ncbi:parallel beta-helix repeat protein [Methanococcus voltae]|uniref:Parallel beta-helix repeat protein n=1 Tax=Methanococcus voltae TaxID=2188 RepID=A0A8J7UTS2_METVO|nr:NosD domain-containing protein [Methanococcus voltae]MBP2201968.1 parallel beta-helix repeat protein [Methanococcus voltae]
MVQLYNLKGDIFLIFLIFCTALMLFSNFAIADTIQNEDNCFLSSEYVCIDNLDDVSSLNNKVLDSLDATTFEKSAAIHHVENISYRCKVQNIDEDYRVLRSVPEVQTKSRIVDDNKTTNIPKYYLSKENFSEDKNYPYVINSCGKYYITEDIDIYPGICLNTSDVLIEGMGHILTSNRSNSTIANAGITNLRPVHNITVQNYHVVENNAGSAIRYGIYNITFINCSTIDCNTGFLFQGAENMTFINCNVTGSTSYGFVGSTTDSAYFENCYCNKDFNQAFAFILVEDIVLKNVLIENSGAGVYTAYCEDITLENCTVMNNSCGTYILRTSDMVFNKYDVKNSQVGLLLIITENVTIKNSKLCRNTLNAQLACMEDAKIENNSFSHGERGVYNDIISGEPDTHFKNITIVNNRFVNNSMYALSAEGTSQDNWVYLNNFCKNKNIVDGNFLKGNYMNSPIITYTYGNKAYTGRLGNYYGKGCGKHTCGVYNTPKCVIHETDL